jgi:hypothetical protein
MRRARPARTDSAAVIGDWTVRVIRTNPAPANGERSYDGPASSSGPPQSETRRARDGDFLPRHNALRANSLRPRHNRHNRLHSPGTYSKLPMPPPLGRRRGPREPPAERGLPAALFARVGRHRARRTSRPRRRLLPPMARYLDKGRWHRHSCLCSLTRTGRNACATGRAARTSLPQRRPPPPAPSVAVRCRRPDNEKRSSRTSSS